MSEAVELVHREYGDPASARPPVVLLHGLFGSSVNWHSMAQRLAEGRRVIVPDLRNHGRSPHSEVMDYPAMTRDLLALIDRLTIDAAVVVGHSMGGKVAMLAALEPGSRVAAAGVVDIAPVRYPDRFGHILEGLQAVDAALGGLSGRREADALLEAHVDSPAVRQFLLQNLYREDGAWHWRLNLPVVIEAMPAILDFPAHDEAAVFPGPALFVYGRQSSHVGDQERRAAELRFPSAEFVGIEGAGHWVYAEQPEPFLDALGRFLARIP